VGSAQSKLAAKDLLQRATAPEKSADQMPHAMVVVAHPDDETISLGARLGRFHEGHFVHVTDGAPRNEQDSRAHGFSSLADYRQERAGELSELFVRAGLDRVSRSSLGVPDQEATLNLAEIIHQLLQHIAHHQPEVIFTHPYEGGHPDHDACAFAVHHAVALHRARGRARPLILEAPFYHAGPKQQFESGAFLDVAMFMPEVVYHLSPEEQGRKQALIACFGTQRETLKGFHASTERYRIAPVYDFTRPPHPGKVYYDRYPWGMTSNRFCALAVDAETRLSEGGGAF
jgi:N-acetylglucosamine malate deacetylase 2